MYTRYLDRSRPPLAVAAEVPVVLQLVRPVGVAEGVVLVVQVVGGQLLPRPDVHHGAAHEPHVELQTKVREDFTITVCLA